ncbi:gp436 family protein [Desulfopila inferna]|uniref:gp436 family protein n=1 Tax=Desulfopila inferna TaxID=468528 RepID=UPI0019643035|nr:DUF1320 domain-containing protein [Desulfopila inferna]MBM9605966.1 DUF1320 domain-containing protein [Desulfopila inferna]
MSYATLADLKNKLDEETLIQLSDDADTGSVVNSVIDAALEAADVEIDSYLAAKYSLPLVEGVQILTHVAADIAIVNLYSRRNGPPEHWQKKYDNHISFLEKVVAGEISLGASTPVAGDEAQVISSERIFSRDSLKGY